MQRVHTGTLAEAYLIKGALEVGGIAATVRGEHLADAGYAEAVAEMRPSVWVDEADADAARVLIAEHRSVATVVEVDDGVAGVDDEAAQRAMSELFPVASRLARDPRRGDMLDELFVLTGQIAEAAPPYGIDRPTWEQIAALSTAVVTAQAASDEDGVQEAARDLQDFLRQLV